MMVSLPVGDVKVNLDIWFWSSDFELDTKHNIKIMGMDEVTDKGYWEKFQESGAMFQNH